MSQATKILTHLLQKQAAESLLSRAGKMVGLGGKPGPVQLPPMPGKPAVGATPSPKPAKDFEPLPSQASVKIPLEPKPAPAAAAKPADVKVKPDDMLDKVPATLTSGSALDWMKQNKLKTVGGAPLVAGAASSVASGTNSAVSGTSDMVGNLPAAYDALTGKTAPAAGAAAPKEPGMLDQAGKAIGDYANSFTQPVGEWGAGQWGGIGAAGLLTYLLMKRRGDDSDDE